MPDTSSGPQYGVRRLDYKGADIKMNITTPIEAQFRIGACAKEPWTVAFIDQIPQDGWFIDVGANTGPYTLVATSRGIHTVAIEPGYETFRSLCHNLTLNGWLDRAIPMCLGLSNKTGFDWFHYSDMRSGANDHVVGGTQKVGFHSQVIPVMRLDDLVGMLQVNGAPLYIKIDVDGSERAVLEGAERLLATDQVKGMIVEFDRKSAETLVPWLAERGWNITARYEEGERFKDMFYALLEKVGAPELVAAI